MKEKKISVSRVSGIEVQLTGWTLVGYVLVALILLLQLVQFAPATMDDSYISYRYAQNLYHGNGLVYNALEPAVEGYSNFLWTVLHVPGVALFEDPMFYSKGLGVLLLVVNLWLVFRLIGILVPKGGGYQCLGLIVLLSSPGFVYWHLVGMEAPLYTTFLLAALLAWVKEEQSGKVGLAWLAWLGLLLTRIDAPVVVATVAACLLAGVIFERNNRSWRRFVTTYGLIALGYGLYTASRYVYFGDLLPNTYYAKLFDTSDRTARGLAHLGSIARFHPLLLLLPFSVWRGRHLPLLQRRFLFVSAIVIVVQLAYIVYVGGDWMPLHRFYVPFAPLLVACLVVAFGLKSAQQAGDSPVTRVLPRWGVAFGLAIAVLGHATFHLSDEPAQVLMHTLNVEVGKILGDHLARTSTEGQVMANAAAGAGPYFSRMETIDTSGINDRHIARGHVPDDSKHLVTGHEKGDGGYVLSREPDILVFVLGRRPSPGAYVSDAQMAFDPALYAYYKTVRFSLSRSVRQHHLLRANEKFLPYYSSLHGMRRVPSRFGMVVESEPTLTMYLYLRSEPIGPNRLLREAFAEIDVAARNQDYERAIALLHEHTELISGGELGDVIDPMLMHYNMLNGNYELARQHYRRALKNKGPLEELFRIWVQSRSAIVTAAG